MLRACVALCVMEQTVVIVGAGLAGLAAAKELQSQGFKVIVLEAREVSSALHTV